MHVRTPSVLLAILLAGCGGVASTVPASDEATSRVDERLLGFWRVDTTATPDAKNEGILVVGRHEGSDKTLDLVTVSFNRDHRIEVDRGEFLATTIEKQEYASLRVPGKGPPNDKDAGMGDETGGKDGEPGKAAWFLLRYTMPDGDTLRVLGMSEKETAADVRAGKVPGRVDESKSAGSGEPTLNVTLQATTTVLRAYLGSRGEAVFKADKPLVLRRLSVR